MFYTPVAPNWEALGSLWEEYLFPDGKCAKGKSWEEKYRF